MMSTVQWELGREMDNGSWVATNLADAVSELWFVPAECRCLYWELLANKSKQLLHTYDVQGLR